MTTDPSLLALREQELEPHEHRYVRGLVLNSQGRFTSINSDVLRKIVTILEAALTPTPENALCGARRAMSEKPPEIQVIQLLEESLAFFRRWFGVGPNPAVGQQLNWMESALRALKHKVDWQEGELLRRDRLITEQTEALAKND